MFGRIDTLERFKHKLLTVELCDVIREYRVGGQPVRALDEINLVLEGGQFASIFGPSGAGKSTSLHVLGALESPASGSIMFDGQEIGGLSDEEQSAFRHHRVGFIFQFFNLLPTLSAWENVAVPRLLDGVRLGKAKADAIRLAGPGRARQPDRAPTGGAVRRANAACRGGPRIDDGPAADPGRRTDREPRFRQPELRS